MCPLRTSDAPLGSWDSYLAVPMYRSRHLHPSNPGAASTCGNAVGRVDLATIGSGPRTTWYAGAASLQSVFPSRRRLIRENCAVSFQPATLGVWSSSGTPARRPIISVSIRVPSPRHTVLGDFLGTTASDPDHHSGDEHRYITIGSLNRGRLPMVAHAERHETIRIVSARKLTRNERGVYEETQG